MDEKIKALSVAIHNLNAALKEAAESGIDVDIQVTGDIGIGRIGSDARLSTAKQIKATLTKVEFIHFI